MVLRNKGGMVMNVLKLVVVGKGTSSCEELMFMVS